MRAVRVLRPLRTVNRVPGMRVLVRSLLDALPAMGSVVVLTSFIFLVFGIIGVQLFSGTLHHRCYYDEAVALPLARRLCSAGAHAAGGPLCTGRVEATIGSYARALHEIRLSWAPTASGRLPGALPQCEVHPCRACGQQGTGRVAVP